MSAHAAMPASVLLCLVLAMFAWFAPAGVVHLSYFDKRFFVGFQRFLRAGAA
jgi:hypothetical protein